MEPMEVMSILKIMIFVLLSIVGYAINYAILDDISRDDHVVVRYSAIVLSLVPWLLAIAFISAILTYAVISGISGYIHKLIEVARGN